jgi:hypothetical protein
VITISIWHRGDNLVVAGGHIAKKHIRCPGHHLTNVELAHRALPRVSLLSKVSGNYDKRKEKTDYVAGCCYSFRTFGLDDVEFTFLKHQFREVAQFSVIFDNQSYPLF